MKVMDSAINKIAGISARLFIIMTVLAGIVSLAAGASITSTHLDLSVNEFGCGACHKGHGRPGSAMLRKDVPELCFNCHSPMGDGPVRASSDVYSAMFKRYKHPVIDTARYHRGNEKMPEETGAKPRHISCLDCHAPHAVGKENVLQGAPGYDRRGTKKDVAENESEVCYRCHADSVNKPFSSRNTREEFSVSNVSFHPVEKTSKGLSVSLKSGMSGKTITCSDCHHPHGSEYPYMLRYNYMATNGPESQYSYELCYKCHKRDSILSDQSFKGHRKHIVLASTSCATCHRAHGSTNNKRLIEFNTTVVRPNRAGAQTYSKIGESSSCSLNCHGVEHDGDRIERGPSAVTGTRQKRK